MTIERKRPVRERLNAEELEMLNNLCTDTGMDVAVIQEYILPYRGKEWLYDTYSKLEILRKHLKRYDISFGKQYHLHFLSTYALNFGEGFPNEVNFYFGTICSSELYSQPRVKPFETYLSFLVDSKERPQLTAFLPVSRHEAFVVTYHAPDAKKATIKGHGYDDDSFTHIQCLIMELKNLVYARDYFYSMKPTNCVESLKTFSIKPSVGIYQDLYKEINKVLKVDEVSDINTEIKKCTEELQVLLGNLEAVQNTANLFHEVLEDFQDEEYFLSNYEDDEDDDEE